MSLSSLLSSIFPSASCDAPEEKEVAEKVAEEPEAEEEEEEEPEDPMVELREECQQGSCAKFTHHFAHCQEKVEAGEGFKGEDCVEEMFHMMHCVDACVGPKLFAKLK
ncbi:Non-heme 11 kDa of cytochrome bc1 complex [Pyrrhoderma noxium]|uniref:Non-heme 11 kDa of cytochrome bc1 complex n=1 Tax=Pyrrhoderma noxium TaxID=2282107 RepID=A0A286U7R0_9AGAM|nr:Non-heme 11 kDa of cytochrome bc1 complex [Pyrrhoderma noxium]